MNTLLPVFEKGKFLSFPEKLKHKKAAEFIRLIYESGAPLASYREIETWLELPQVENSDSALADRYHFHLRKASLSLIEHNFLKPVKRFDTLSNTPYLPLAIYLEHLRSGHNVGSILRTVEAFRLGTVYFSSQTPGVTNKKVSDAAMGTAPFVPTRIFSSFEELPSPLIALETVEEAAAFTDFHFPKTFTLLIGNEEYGLSADTLNRADHVVQIPLCGSKNSLNASCAFAIIAAEISRQLRS